MRTDALQPVSSGAGPILERDYWGVVERCRRRPSEIVALVASRFAEFAPSELVTFQSRAGQQPLEIGDELEIRIRMTGTARVRVVHKDACSLTLATLTGHPEAGRITFGAYRSERGEVIFHIRSRARASSRRNYVGFLLGGNPMQTGTWTDFVRNVAATCGKRVAGSVRGHTRLVSADELQAADESMDGPTYLARAD